jgi:hypothetical protein
MYKHGWISLELLSHYMVVSSNISMDMNRTCDPAIPPVQRSDQLIEEAEH